MTRRAAYPSSGADLFSDEALMDPYPHYERLRAAGAAVHLDTTGAFALPRYAEVRAALADWRTFSSRGIGLTEERNEAMDGTILASDPPDHDALRKTLDYGLSPRVLRQEAEATIKRRSQEIVEAAVARGSFDAVEDLARAFPLSVVLDLIGLPQEGRDRVLDWADGAFNSFGPDNERTRSGAASVGDLWGYLYTSVTPDRLAPGSMGRKVHEAAERGEIPPETLFVQMAAFITAGLDTTIHAIGSGIWLFARHPDQWDLVRGDPDRMIPMAFNEILRIESPVQFFGRRVNREHEVDGVTLPEGSQVLLMYGSANRDERKWENPERFDVTRNPVDHLAFGHGVHKCAGQGLARMEFAAVFDRLARTVGRFEIDGEPERHLNNVVRGLSSLPVSARRTA